MPSGVLLSRCLVTFFLAATCTLGVPRWGSLYLVATGVSGVMKRGVPSGWGSGSLILVTGCPPGMAQGISAMWYRDWQLSPYTLHQTWHQGLRPGTWGFMLLNWCLGKGKLNFANFQIGLTRSFWKKCISRLARVPKAGTQNRVKYAPNPKNKGTLFRQLFMKFDKMPSVFIFVHV